MAEKILDSISIVLVELGIEESSDVVSSIAAAIVDIGILEEEPS